MMKAKQAHEENRKRLIEMKDLLTRLHKGQGIIEAAYKERSVALAFDAIKLYGLYSSKLLRLLEESTMLNEYLMTGQTVLVNRKGKAINISSVADGDIEIDPETLLTMRSLKEVFGEDFREFVEFVDMDQE